MLPESIRVRTIAAILVLVAGPIWCQTTYTTNAGLGTVDFRSGSTWVGGVAPPTGCPSAPGFKVVLADGTTVSTPGGTVFCPGTSGSGSTVDVSCATNTGTGSLSIAGTLQFRGSIRLCNGGMHLLTGASLLHDSSAAVSPSSTNYTVGIAASSVAGGKVYIDGAGVTMGIAAGSGVFGGFGTNGGYPDNGQLVSAANSSVSIDSCGTSGGWCIEANPSSSTASFDLSNVAFTNSSRVGFMGLSASATWRMRYYSITSPTNSTGISFGNGGTCPDALTTGTRELSHGYMYGAGFSVNCTPGLDLGFTLTENLWGALEPNQPTGFSQLSYSGSVGLFGPGEWTNSVAWQRLTDGSGPIPAEPPGYISNSVWLSDTPGETCASGTDVENITHLPQAPSIIGVQDGMIWQARCGGNNNKGLQVSFSGVATANYPLEIKNSLFLPGQNGLGWLQAILGVSNQHCNGITTFCGQIKIHHSTIAINVNPGGGPCGALASESTGSGEISAGVFQGTYDNYFWSPVATYTSGGYSGQPVGGCILSTTSVTPDVPGVFAGTNDYNGIQTNMNTPAFFPSQTPFYRFGTTDLYTSTPGVHDQRLNANFVAPTRDFLSWCQSIDPSVTTWDTCFAKFSDLNSASHDSRYTVSAMTTWIKAGFVPTNQTMGTIGDNGGYIGAFPPTTAVGGTMMGGTVRAAGGIISQ